MHIIKAKSQFVNSRMAKIKHGQKFKIMFEKEIPPSKKGSDDMADNPLLVELLKEYKDEANVTRLLDGIAKADDG